MEPPQHEHVTFVQYQLQHWARPVYLPREIINWLAAQANRWLNEPDPSKRIQIATDDAHTALLNAIKPFNPNCPLQYLGFDAFEYHRTHIQPHFKFTTAVEPYVQVPMSLAESTRANCLNRVNLTKDSAIVAMGCLGASKVADSALDTLKYANRPPIVKPTNTLTPAGLISRVGAAVKGFFVGIALGGASNGGPEISFMARAAKMTQADAAKSAVSIAKAMAGTTFLKTLGYEHAEFEAEDPTALDNVKLLAQAGCTAPSTCLLNQDFRPSPGGTSTTQSSTASSQSSPSTAPLGMQNGSQKEVISAPTLQVPSPAVSVPTSQEFVQQMKSHLCSLESCVRDHMTPDQRKLISTGARLVASKTGIILNSMSQKVTSLLQTGINGCRDFRAKIAQKLSVLKSTLKNTITRIKDSLLTPLASSVKSSCGQLWAHFQCLSRSSHETLLRLIRSIRRRMGRSYTRFVTTSMSALRGKSCSSVAPRLMKLLHSSALTSVAFLRRGIWRLTCQRMTCARTPRALTSHLGYSKNSALDLRPFESSELSCSSRPTNHDITFEQPCPRAWLPAHQIQRLQTLSPISRCFWWAVEKLDLNLENLQLWLEEMTCFRGSIQLPMTSSPNLTETVALSQRSSQATQLKTADSAVMPSIQLAKGIIIQPQRSKLSSKCSSQSTASAKIPPPMSEECALGCGISSTTSRSFENSLLHSCLTQHSLSVFGSQLRQLYSNQGVSTSEQMQRALLQYIQRHTSPECTGFLNRQLSRFNKQ